MSGPEGPEAADGDTAALEERVDALGDRLRSLPESALRRGAAAAGLALARELARRAQALEQPHSPPRELPDAGIFAVGDQLAVAGHDLAYALREATRSPRLRTAAPGELASALRLVRSHRF